MIKKMQTPAQALTGLVEGATQKWAKQRKSEERDASARARRDDRMIRYCRPMSLREAAFRVMRAAYMAASDNGKLPANARQIYYAARPKILEMTGKVSLDAKYFSQTLLIDYMQETGVDWDIIWDDRGHFSEPHTDRGIGLGTLNVRNYLQKNKQAALEEIGISDPKIDTHGPDGRFGAVLFIEKEGFLPLFEAVRLAERYDIAIMSSKGMSVTAARLLADKMCSKWNIPLLFLHDFDIAGFSIAATLQRDTRRYCFENAIETIDLGLRRSDVEELGLHSECVGLGNIDPAKLRHRLKRNGATDEEIKFLMSGRRVELNAMTSSQFIAFVEAKLKAHGVHKVIPDNERLLEAFELFMKNERVREAVETAMETMDDEDEIAAPDDLERRVREYLEQNPASTWDEAVCRIAAGFAAVDDDQ